MRAKHARSVNTQTLNLVVGNKATGQGVDEHTIRSTSTRPREEQSDGHDAVEATSPGYLNYNPDECRNHRSPVAGLLMQSTRAWKTRGQQLNVSDR